MKHSDLCKWTLTFLKQRKDQRVDKMFVEFSLGQKSFAWHDLENEHLQEPKWCKIQQSFAEFSCRGRCQRPGGLRFGLQISPMVLHSSLQCLYEYVTDFTSTFYARFAINIWTLLYWRTFSCADIPLWSYSQVSLCLTSNGLKKSERKCKGLKKILNLMNRKTSI